MMRKKGTKKKVQLKPLDKIQAPFVCSGKFQFPKTLRFFYGHEESSGTISFPSPKIKDIQTAIKNAKKSGFGKGTQNVMDEEYRLAFEYLPESLGLPSYFEETILQDVRQAISNQLCSKETVRAELIKLNIYPKSGKFKNHVDSPVKDAFGSLVVFLPCNFEGGALKVRHNNKEEVYDFSTNEQGSKEIKWVAFFNDCVHEITQVTAGYRLTLSYNLFYSRQETSFTVYPKQEILSILSEMQQNKTYGYYCQHYYGNNALATVKEGFEQHLLKGKDAQFLAAVRSLGVKKIDLKIIYKVQDYNKREYQDQTYISFKGNPTTISEVKAGLMYDEYIRQQNPVQTLKKKMQSQQIDPDQVEWLNTVKDDSKYAYAIDGFYGNNYSISESYCELAILIST